MLKMFQHLRQKWTSSVNYRITLNVSFNVEIISTTLWWKRWGVVNSVWSLHQSLHIRWWSLLIKPMANLHSFFSPNSPLSIVNLQFSFSHIELMYFWNYTESDRIFICSSRFTIKFWVFLLVLECILEVCFKFLIVIFVRLMLWSLSKSVGCK